MLLKPYDPSWPIDFNCLKNSLIEALKDDIITIEHVGSTSIIGLVAKPIIDIDIVYEANQYWSTIKINLEKIGYVHHGDQGIYGREVFKRPSLFSSNHAIFDKIRHHLYVCKADNYELKKHLYFRDLLNSNPEIAKNYGELKIKLANEANQDQKIYAALKAEKAKVFFDEIFIGIK